MQFIPVCYKPATAIRQFYFIIVQDLKQVACGKLSKLYLLRMLNYLWTNAKRH